MSDAASVVGRDTCACCAAGEGFTRDDASGFCVADCDVGTQLLQSALVLGIAFGSDDHMNWQLSLHLSGRAQKPNNSIEFALICGMRPVRVFRSDQRAVERQEKQDCNARVID